MRRFWHILPLIAMLAYSLPGIGGEFRVLLLLSNDSPAYKSFSQTLARELPSSIKLETKVLAVGSAPPGLTADLIIAGGILANDIAFANSKGPVLSVLVSKADYEDLLKEKHSAIDTSAIFLEQSPKRQTTFLYALLPKLESIGLLYSSSSRFELNTFMKQVASRGGRIVAQSVRSPEMLFSNLEKVLNSTDVLLAIPDNEIYNSNNIRNILLTSYRNEVPLVGYSQGYVNAGALAALFATPEQLAVQARKHIVFFQDKRTLESPNYPDDFTVAINYQVARSLGLQLPSEGEVNKRMHEEEEGRR